MKSALRPAGEPNFPQSTDREPGRLKTVVANVGRVAGSITVLAGALFGIGKMAEHDKRENDRDAWTMTTVNRTVSDIAEDEDLREEALARIQVYEAQVDTLVTEVEGVTTLEGSNETFEKLRSLTGFLDGLASLEMLKAGGIHELPGHVGVPYGIGESPMEKLLEKAAVKTGMAKEGDLKLVALGISETERKAMLSGLVTDLRNLQKAFDRTRMRLAKEATSPIIQVGATSEKPANLER